MDKSLYQYHATAEVPRATWFALFVLGITLPVLLLMSINILSDRFSIFFPWKEQSTANQNYGKMHYLLSEPKHFEYLLMGSSRANALDIQGKISKNVYTLSMNAGIPHYYYLNLKTLLENGVTVDTVLLGLGESAYLVPSLPDDQLPSQNRLHPKTLGINKIIYYLPYILLIPEFADLQLFKTNLKQLFKGTFFKPSLTKRIQGNGRTDCNHCEDIHDDLIEDKLWPLLAVADKLYKNRVESGLADIEAIVNLAAEHDINLLVYVDPIYLPLYHAMDIAQLNNFKRGLSQITPFLDFSIVHPHFADMRNFSDFIHFRQSTGDLLLRDINKVLAGQTDALEYSVWVNQNNVENHLQILSREINITSKMTSPQ